MKIEGAETLLVERVMTALHLEPVQDTGERPKGDPIVWALWKVLEARRSLDDNYRRRIIATILSWAVEALPAREVESSLRTPIYPSMDRGPKAASSPTVFRLARTLRAYLEKPTLSGLLELARSVKEEAYRPCSKPLGISRERDRLERIMARLGLVIGVLFSAFFIVSILLAAHIAIVGVMIIVMGIVWYMVRAYGLRYAVLNAEEAWLECSIRGPEDLARAVVGYTPMQLFADLLFDDNGSRRQ